MAERGVDARPQIRGGTAELQQRGADEHFEGHQRRNGEARQPERQLAVVRRGERQRLARFERNPPEVNGRHALEQRLDQIAGAHRDAARGEEHISRGEAITHCAPERVFVIQGVVVPHDLGASVLGRGHQRIAIAIAD